MENGRQLKIQRWIEEREEERTREMMRKRNRERERNESRRERYMREKGKKDRKGQTVGRILQRSAHPFPHSPSPPRKIMADGCACCFIFEFTTIRSLVFAFSSFLFPIPLQACSLIRVLPEDMNWEKTRVSRHVTLSRETKSYNPLLLTRAQPACFNLLDEYSRK